MATNLSLTLSQAGALLSRWLGAPTPCTRVTPLDGGMIHSVVRLDFECPPHRAVAKLSETPGEPAFTREVQALAYLHAHTRLPCPHVYLLDGSQQGVPFSLLLLETIPGVPLTAAKLDAASRRRVDEELAAALLELHSHTRATYGDLDGPGSAAWLDVLHPRLEEMRREVAQRLPREVLADIDRALAALPRVFAAAGPPTLVHGDIWAGNIMVEECGDGWHLAGLLDPGSHYADVEQELAYLQVFETVGRSFFEAYTRERPLRPGFELRRLFYWLHTLMIHVWLFGGEEYALRTAEVARGIERRLRGETGFRTLPDK